MAAAERPAGHPLAGARLATFSAAGVEVTAGLVHRDRVVPLAAALAQVHGTCWPDRPSAEEWLRAPARLELFLAIESWPELLQPVVASLDDLAAAPGTLPLTGVRLRPPVQQPQKIVAVGLNYASHAAEAERAAPDYPVLFAKFANTLTGAYDDVPIPRATHRIDYEGELAVVIGRRAHAIDRADADGYVAGYAVANDVSARDYQFRTREMLQGKTFDHFCPLGPWLTKPRPADQLGPLRLTTTVSGEPRQSAALGEMVFDVPFLIEYLSTIMTLLPGDVLLTGTPGGIGAAMKPRRWLRDGDTVEIEIAGIGRIANRFTALTGTA
jgi:acylpyruvate hydrolase